MCSQWKAERDFQVTETWVSNDILDLSFPENNFIPVLILWEISVAYLQICVFWFAMLAVEQSL